MNKCSQQELLSTLEAEQYNHLEVTYQDLSDSEKYIFDLLCTKKGSAYLVDKLSNLEVR